MKVAMSGIDSISEKLGISDPWVEKRGVHWLETSANTVSIRELAQVMGDFHARLVTITAYQLPGEEGTLLEYYWDLGGKLMGFPFKLAANSIDSIYDICEAADWIEREIHEEYVVNFVGREYEPLLLREGDTPGVNLREETI